MTTTATRVWFTPQQAGEYTGWSAKTIHRALRDGSLKGTQHTTGGRWRIHIEDLDAWQRGETA